jgi:hypothetical protein
VLYPFVGLLAQPDDRERGHDIQLGVRDRQRATPEARLAVKPARTIHPGLNGSP